MSIIKIGSYCLSILFIACSSSKKESINSFFEGRIVYQLSFIPKSPEVDTNSLRKNMGFFTTYYFKKGNYHQIDNNESHSEEYGFEKDNKIYSRGRMSDTFFWHDKTIPEKISSHEKFVKADNVLDISCDELVTKLDRCEIRYYYNSDTLQIEPHWFTNFKYLTKDETSKIMGSHFLKCELDYSKITIILTAVFINPEKLNDSLFELPKNAIIVKNL
jgi:hypothetical protein